MPNGVSGLLDKKMQVLKGIVGAMTQGVIVLVFSQYILLMWQTPLVQTIIKATFEGLVKIATQCLPVAFHFLVPSLLIAIPLVIIAMRAYVVIDWQALRKPQEEIDQPSFIIFSVAMPTVGFVLSVTLGGMGLAAASMLTIATTAIASGYFIVYQQHQIDTEQRKHLAEQRQIPVSTTGSQSYPEPPSSPPTTESRGASFTPLHKASSSCSHSSSSSAVSQNSAPTPDRQSPHFPPSL